MSSAPLIPELTILSFGAGQDSTALLHLYLNEPDFRRAYAPKRTIVAIAATLNEHPATDAHVSSMKELCAARGVEFVHITPDMGFHTGAWSGGLVGQWRAHNTIGSAAYPKSCTDSLKIKPLWSYVEHVIERDYGYAAIEKRGLRAFTERYGKINCIIGIAKGEERRIHAGPTQPMLPLGKIHGSRKKKQPPKWLIECVNRIYPLCELGMDRAACQHYITNVVGAYCPPPSNCVFCPYKSHQEVLWTARRYPDLFAIWVSLEAAKLRAWEGRTNRLGAPIPNYGVKGRQTLVAFLAEAERKYGHWSLDELDTYIFSHGHCVASKY